MFDWFWRLFNGKPALTESQELAKQQLEQILEQAMLYWIHNPDGAESNPLSQLIYSLTVVSGSTEGFLLKTVRLSLNINLAFYNSYSLSWGHKSSWLLGQEPPIWIELTGSARDEFPQLTMLIDDYLRQSDLLKK